MNFVIGYLRKGVYEAVFGFLMVCDALKQTINTMLNVKMDSALEVKTFNVLYLQMHCF